MQNVPPVFIMKKHTKNYFDHFKLHGVPFVFDEYEWVKNGMQVRAQDIHHIEQKGMGGSKLRDNVENLIALTRENHNDAHANVLTREVLHKIHKQFMQNNPY